MTVISDAMCSLGLPIGWSTLLAAWPGIPGVTRAELVEEISHLAHRLLAEGTYSDALLTLSIARSEEVSVVERALTSLVDPRDLDRATELRKWRVHLLVESLRTLPPDPVQGLVELITFWSAWDSPTYAIAKQGPHRAFGNDYSEAALALAVARHEEWAREEIADLRSQAPR